MIPQATAQPGTEEFYRARLVVVFSMGLVVLLLLVGVTRLGLGRTLPAVLTFVQAGLSLVLLWLFREGMTLQRAAHTLIAVMFSGPLLLILGSGGSLTVPLMVMVLFPVFASILTGARGGFFWSVVSVVSVLVGLGLSQSDLAMPIQSSATDWERSRLIGLPFLMIVSVFIAWVEAHLKSVTLDELKSARREADAASAAKSRFLANMSHEIRTPLNGVIGTGRLLRRTPMAGEQQELLDTMVTSGEALLELLDGILDLSKIEAGRMTLESIPLDLEQIATGVVALLNSQAKYKSIDLRTELLGAGPWWMYGDSTRLRQVLLNLLGNAIKFTPTGSVTLRISLEDDAATMEVIDTGIGIDSERLPDLFKEFTQTDATTTRRFGGTGLGLAICQHFVHLMKGDLLVQSTLGAGTTFSVRLPTQRAQPATSEDPCALERLDGLRVLVVEDHPVNQFITQKMLEQMGCEVVIVDDGAKAVETVRRGAFDVVLMDCHMPIMDGFMAARAIRKEGYGSLPIIALTAAATTEDRQRCFEAGMNGYLTKPVSLTELTRSLARHRER
ncbi:MAG: response regulator [Myxococcota bacterium]|nr:response regulator [Myxococcota bacterium]